MKRSRLQEMSMEVTVGAFLFMVLLALGFFTIILSHENIFQPTYRLEVMFEEVMGLREGDNVFLRGVDIGSVKSLTVKTEGVHLVATLNQPVTLHEDYRIEILPTSVLGGRYLYIIQGSPEKPEVSTDQVLQGTQPIDLIDEASQAVTMVRDALDEGGILENLKATMSQFRNVSERLSNGEGTLGKLLADDAVYEDLKGISESMHAVSVRLERGEGSLGKLLTDDAVYDDLKALAADFRTISGRIERGEGTVGRLLSNDDTLYRDLQASVASIQKITEGIEQGEGTLGQIMTDEALYRDMQALVLEARAAIDDFREASPITTFSSVFFGAF